MSTPAATPTAAPAAPASGGTPSPTPAPAPSPAPAPTPSPGPAAPDLASDNPFDAIDKKIAERRKKPETPAKPKEGAELEPAPTEPTPTEPAGGEKPAEKRKISGVENLRGQLEKTDGELKEARRRVSDMETKIKDLEVRGKDAALLTERLTKLEKERDELLAERRALKHELSPEFTAKYVAPFNRAAESVKELIEQIPTVESTTEEGGLVPSRAGTWDDFIAIYQLPYGRAYGEARKMFGDHSAVVMQQYTILHGMQKERNAALESERANFKQREQEEAARRTGEIETIKATSQRVRQEVIEKGGEDYQADPKNDDEKGLVKTATDLFDARPATIQQRLVKDAHIRAKLIGYYLAQHRLSQARDRIAELEAKLAERKSSAPGETRRPGGGEITGGKNWREELKESMS